ncbi:MAG: outer membrane beta-barrel family protein [Gelidibacter sp.]
MKRPTIFFLIFCALLSTTLCFGQEFSISGFVDDTNGEAIAFANVFVHKAQDSTVLKGVSTDERGFFLIDGLPQERYLVKISFLGFKDVSVPVDLKENIDLKTIALEENSETLDEINIIAQKPTLKKEADRLVFNIENTALIEGNMFQVLKSTPGILVLDNSIQVKNSTPTVYINEKKVHLSNEELIQLLEGSSAGSVKSVEVITNPSAKYDAQSGAVINIVMSKNLITGYRGNVFANYIQGVFPRYEAGTSHFFKNDKIDFFANYTYSDSKINRDQDNTVNYLDSTNDIDQTYTSRINRNTWSKTHNFNFNFDYSINDSNTLSLSSTMLVLPYFKYKIKNATTIFDANQNLDSYLMTNNLSHDDKYNLGFDLDYVHRFKKDGEKLSFNTHYTTFNYNRKQRVMSDYFDNDATFLQTTAYRTDNNQDTNIFTGQMDYVLPIDDTSTFETGLKISNIKNKSDITQFDIDNGQETIDINNTDAFDYDESVFAAYIDYSKDWEKLSVSAGLRAEQTNVEGFSILDNATNKQDYLKWFPTASVNYTFSEKFSLYANYKRSIQRPDYQSLNPFQFFLNDFTIVKGSPDLQPVLIDFVEMGTQLYKQFTIQTYYKVYNDNIYELPRQDNQNNTLTYTVVNLDKTTEYGFDFITYFDVVSNWSVYFVTSFYNTKDEGIFDGEKISKDTWSNYSILSNDLTFLKDKSLNANFTLTYIGKSIQGFQEVEDRLASELAVSKSILKKRGTLSLTISDLFNTQDFNIKTLYKNQNSFSFTDIDDRYVKLGFRYKFGNTNLNTNQRKKEQQELDRLKAKDN